MKVNKTVEGNAGDKDKEFHFTVTLSDSAINGTYGDMTFAGGVAEITLKHGESAAAAGLPAGITYEVTEAEADQDGYVTTSEGTKGTIVEGETVTASFTNTKEEVPPEQPQKPQKPNTMGKPNKDMSDPKTGDQTNIGLYLSLFALSGLICTILGLIKKKNCKNR